MTKMLQRIVTTIDITRDYCDSPGKYVVWILCLAIASKFDRFREAYVIKYITSNELALFKCRLGVVLYTVGAFKNISIVAGYQSITMMMSVCSTCSLTSLRWTMIYQYASPL